jgi:energy-coupling factor transporter ATP-binding protein EcfA2
MSKSKIKKMLDSIEDVESYNYYEFDLDSDKDSDIKNYHQWTIVGDGSFIPCYETIRELKPGLFEPIYNHRNGEWTMMKQKVNTDELYELPTEEIGIILKDLKSFWSKQALYKQYKLMHKRGVLLYGDPGCGKSGILQLCMNHIINDLSGIVINIKDSDSLRGFIEIVTKFRQIEPTRPLVVIIEDIDAIAEDGQHATSQLLNMLDGVKQIENVVYIATTNYPEKLAERITNRPSRFDRRYYISPPTPEVRMAYLKNKSGDAEGIDFDVWVKDTEGMSMSHLKELFISVFLLDKEYADAIKDLRELKKLPKGKKTKGVGFNNSSNDN